MALSGLKGLIFWFISLLNFLFIFTFISVFLWAFSLFIYLISVLFFMPTGLKNWARSNKTSWPCMVYPSQRVFLHQNVVQCVSLSTTLWVISVNSLSVLENSYCGMHVGSFCQATIATPRTAWRRSPERERKEMGWQSWRMATSSAKDRDGWTAFWNVLRCPAGHDEGWAEIWWDEMRRNNGHDIRKAGSSRR